MNITNWFTGVVEDVNDPMQLGRVRVRAFGYHTASMTDIPTEDLPWSTCIMPVTSASVSGIGQSATGLLPGSWVMGFFRDGKELQDAVVVGSIPSNSLGVNGERNNGFSDPNGTFPLFNGPDIPSNANSFGFGTSDFFNENENNSNSFNSFFVGGGSKPVSLLGPEPSINISSHGIERMITLARGEVGVKETTKNQGPGISKYWTATSYKNGYNDRQPWCAALVSWCVKNANILPSNHNPNTASAFAFESWGRNLGKYATVSMNPQSISRGDIVVYTFSHIGIATNNSVEKRFRNIEGNTNAAGDREGNGVWEKDRPLSSVRSKITINA